MGEGETSEAGGDRDAWLEALRVEAAAVGERMAPETATVLWHLCGRVAGAPFRATATRDLVELRRKHVVDALTCLPLAALREGERAVDLGSGAGFPGLVVAALRPDVVVELVDAQQKKAQFLEESVEQLGLRNVRVRRARAEALAREVGWRGACDCVLARALAPMRRLAELGLPLCRDGGRLIAFKGPRADEELQEARDALGRWRGRVTGRVELRLPGSGERRVVLRIERVPAGAPRRRRGGG